MGRGLDTGCMPGAFGILFEILMRVPVMETPPTLASTRIVTECDAGGLQQPARDAALSAREAVKWGAEGVGGWGASDAAALRLRCIFTAWARETAVSRASPGRARPARLSPVG